MFWLQNRGQSGSRYIYIYSDPGKPSQKPKPLRSKPSQTGDAGWRRSFARDEESKVPTSGTSGQTRRAEGGRACGVGMVIRSFGSKGGDGHPGSGIQSVLSKIPG